MTVRETPFGIYFKSLLSSVYLDIPLIKHFLKISRHDTTHYPAAEYYLRY